MPTQPAGKRRALIYGLMFLLAAINYIDCSALSVSAAPLSHLYLLHWPGPVPLEDTIAGFEDLRAAGKIRAWGISSFDVADLEEAYAVAGDDRIACNQVLYYLEERAIEHAVTAYSPFGHPQFVNPRTRGGQVLAEIAEAQAATPRLHEVYVAATPVQDAHQAVDAVAGLAEHRGHAPLLQAAPHKIPYGLSHGPIRPAVG